MAAQVLTFSQPSTTSSSFSVGSSAGGTYPSASPMQQARGGNAPRSVYNAQNGTGSRTAGSMNPVPSYAFAATPSLQPVHNPLRQHPAAVRHEDRSVSAPAVQHQRPLLALDLNGPSMQNANKSSPDRYRRTQRQASSQSTPVAGSAQPSGSGMAAVGHLYHHSSQSQSSPTLQSGPGRLTSTDDFNINRHSQSDQARRYRRRSINSIGVDDSAADLAQSRAAAAPAAFASMPRSYAAVASANYVPDRPEPRYTQPHAIRPSSAHGRNNSNESSSSSVRSSSRPRSAKREPAVNPSPSTNTSALGQPGVQHQPSTFSSANNANKPVSVPPRGSSDANKRLTNPSPLSQPMTMSPEFREAAAPGSSGNASAAAPHAPESPAAAHLAALNRKEDQKKGKPSRLRRAFSFGSAAELRKASAANSHESNERAKLQKNQFRTEEEAKEAAIVAQQEASGLGASIYSGQGNFFTGSTDNLSVSSTASSASVMLRKMGKGMKKGGKSLVGLFRPKSVIGVPAADAAVPEPSLAQVSMVTVEAERENANVNVNPDPHDKAGGGTGFPKLERNSIDVARTSLNDGAHDGAEGRPRRSIVGGERERAEVLAAVKKGILKKIGTDSGASSPSARPSDLKPASDYVLPQLPRFNDSPVSSAPSTPKDEGTPRGSHKRTDSVKIEGEDYFINAKLAAAGGDGSLPGTPRSGQKGITFSPKIQFHDTWPSGEYDRRGDIATCNRLTPTLAQQIKEELNSFKMEMEVHESSKIYTHFF